LLVNVCTQDPPAPSSIVANVPDGFDDFIRRALAREPERRFQTAAELTDAFAALTGFDGRLGGVPSSREVAPPEPVARGAVTASPLATTPAPFTRRRRSPVPMLVLLFLSVMVVAIVGVRMVLRGSPTVASESRGSPGSASLPTRSSASALEVAKAPDVTPVTSAVAAFPVEEAKTVSARTTEEPNDPGKRTHAHPTVGAHPAPAKKEKPPTDPGTTRPSRPGDVLGY
jgi:serine/threonine-protein kinase